MKNTDLFEKIIGFAENGNGRRLLNTLHMKETVLTSSELDEVLTVYGETGLPLEVEMLKKRRGLLRDDQYDALAKKVSENCCSDRYDDFVMSLGNLLRSGLRMNPTKTNIDELF